VASDTSGLPKSAAVHQRPAMTRLSAPSSDAQVRFCSRVAKVSSPLRAERRLSTAWPLMPSVGRGSSAARGWCVRLRLKKAHEIPAHGGGMLMKK